MTNNNSHFLSALTQTLPQFTLTGPADPLITGITADSRRVKPGFLFVAYPGVNVDGHRFIPAAIQQGAAAIVIESTADIAIPPTITCLRVPDGREALAHLSAAWYGFPAKQLLMVGITGTDGKTSTTNLVYHILKTAGKRVGMISTVNAVIGNTVLETGLHTTTPDSPDIQRYLAQMVQAGTRICLLETTSHGLAQHRVTACDFDWAVITNITHEHLDIHGSLSAYRRAKAHLVELANTGVILNADDWSFEYLQPFIQPQKHTLSYGITAPADLTAHAIRQTPQATFFDIQLSNQEITVQTPLIGWFNISNVLAALALAVLGLGIDPHTALAALKTFSGVPGRMERINLGQPFIAIVDFAHTPNALRRALEAVRPLTGGRIIAIFGCAGLRDVEKRTLMGQVAADLADLTILTAEDPRTEDPAAIIATTATAMQNWGAVELSADEPLPARLAVHAFTRRPDRGRAIYLATQFARPGDVVITLGKGHEQSMCFGVTEYPWDDRDALRSALQGKPLLTLPTA